MSSKRVVASSLLALTSIVGACGGGTGPTQLPVATSAGTPQAATAAPGTQAASTAAPATQAAADPFELIAGLEGAFTGTWTNTTYGSTGSAGATVTFDRAATAVKITLSLGGNVFGQAAPAPEELTAVITPGQGATFTSKTFGATTVTAKLVNGLLAITMSSSDVPSTRIKTFTATATVDGPTMDITYEVTFRDATPPAQGTATLTKG